MQVIGSEVEDGYTHWQVLPKVGIRWETVKGVNVHHGDTVRLGGMGVRAREQAAKGARGGEGDRFKESTGTHDSPSTTVDTVRVPAHPGVSTETRVGVVVRKSCPQCPTCSNIGPHLVAMDTHTSTCAQIHEHVGMPARRHART